MCVRDTIERGMHLVRTGSNRKIFGISSFMKNASFSSGWLHFAVQIFFAVIIVVSFILIILMSVPFYANNPNPLPKRPNRCHSNNCVVHCDDVPSFGRYEEDIVYTVSKLPESCTEFHLTLRNPRFINETVPNGMIPRLRIPIHDLTIHGGNLMHFPANAFLNQHAASIQTLALYGLVIKTLMRESLVGLSNLKEIYIKECTLVNVQAHVLRPVHDTLKFLTISNSRKWNPINVTGPTNLSQIATVDFSHNIFPDVLGRQSFHGLQNCRILYLNSCQISAIGLGAFDNLLSIETLYLNNNYLVTVPEGLFHTILSIDGVKPRINLQDNMWECDCSAREIRELVQKDMLFTDPVCYSPEFYKDLTFNDFELYCKDNMGNVAPLPSPKTSSPALHAGDIAGFIYVNHGCFNGQEDSSNREFRMMSPVHDCPCTTNEIYKGNISAISATRYNGEMVSNNSWIKFTFVIKSSESSVVQITAEEANEYGILWYQSTCPNEVYCVNAMPSALRVYNIDMNAQYVFCPILLASGSIENDKCVFYNLATMYPVDLEAQLQILFYLTTGGICLAVGAIFVYALVRKNPYLLKGSKRILFVKHKTVDALVLPPKVPLRKDLVDEVPPDLDDKKIFIVSGNSYGTGKFDRNKSTRSSKSSAPSYISALQPTEEQLAEWRIKNHFTNELTTEHATYSWICSAESFHYMDVLDNDRTYESLK